MRTRVTVAFVMLALVLVMEVTRDADARSKLPDLINAGVAQRLYRLDCGRSLANDESVWTPGENVGRSIEFSSTCWPEIGLKPADISRVAVSHTHGDHIGNVGLFTNATIGLPSTTEQECWYFRSEARRARY